MTTADQFATATQIAELIAQHQRLSEQIALMSSKLAIVESAVIRNPIYVAEGLNTVLHMGGWGWPIALPTTHAGVFRDYYCAGLHTVEPGVRAYLLRETPADKIAIDIGAHIGLHAVALGYKVREKGRLILFEPNPEMVACLQLTLLMNGLTNCAVLEQAAVCDHPGRALFSRAAHSPESSLYRTDTIATKDTIEVATVSLDSYFAPGAQIGMIKIDAEGAEPAILRGMTRVMTENPGLKIVMEFAPEHLRRANEDPGSVLASIASRGFRVRLVEDPEGEAKEINADALLQRTTSNICLER